MGDNKLLDLLNHMNPVGIQMVVVILT
jgi:hypothetical protein